MHKAIAINSWIKVYRNLLHMTWFILYISLSNTKVAIHPFFSVSCNLLVILPSFRKLGKHLFSLVSALDWWFDDIAGTLFSALWYLKEFYIPFFYSWVLKLMVLLKSQNFWMVTILSWKNQKKAFHCHLKVNCCVLWGIHLWTAIPRWQKKKKVFHPRHRPGKTTAFDWAENSVWFLCFLETKGEAFNCNADSFSCVRPTSKITCDFAHTLVPVYHCGSDHCQQSLIW